MILNDPSTISRWMAEEGPIQLRHTPERKRDPQAMSGILNAGAIGFAFAVWAYVFIGWLTR